MDPHPEDDPDDLLLLHVQVSRMIARGSAGSREEMPPSGNETCALRARSRIALNKSVSICLQSMQRSSFKRARSSQCSMRYCTRLK
jgi:hypothetical protein